MTISGVFLYEMLPNHAWCLIVPGCVIISGKKIIVLFFGGKKLASPCYTETICQYRKTQWIYYS